MTALHPLIQSRESRRIMDADRDVGEEALLSILEAGRWAPSCANNQSWRFVVAREASLDSVKVHLTRGNAWAENASAIIAAVSRPDLGCRRTGRDYHTLDLGLAIENMLLQGVHLGLVMHPIAGFDEEGVRHALRIPDEFRLFALIVIGYPGTTEQADQHTREKEAEPRMRRTLDEVAFWETWQASNHCRSSGNRPEARKSRF